MIYTLSQLLTETAARFPDKAAVVFQDEAITYQQLDELSNQVAHTLKKNGVQQGDRVGIYINKSIPSVFSIFGILKADAVYVPLDPWAPVKRLGYIIKNCDIKCLLTGSDKMNFVVRMIDAESPLEKVILTDDGQYSAEISTVETIEWTDVQAEATGTPARKSIETDLAYILYTSGSTGDPKGVMISHLNAFTFINWAYETVNIQPEDRVANHAPHHFDLSVFDIFVTVKAGGSLYPVPTHTAKFPVKLAEFISKNKISVWYSVPSAWVHMLTHGKMDEHDFSALRTVIFAGEVFPIKHLQRLVQQIPHADYYNWYGPTETNVITSYKVENLDPNSNTPVSIGKVCENMGIFILDETGKEVTTPGITGELYGRGSGVAQGYWNDPEKTARLFVQNPLQTHFSDRAYRTGDLVQIGDEGNLIYLGRRDHQVKVQGYRIELGEIENALLNHPQIKEAAVVALKNEEQTTYLKAFLTLNGGEPLSSLDIKRQCSRFVPRYMIPEVVEFCDHLPKTSTGKIDKKSLLKVS